MVDESGDVANHYTYEPYGELFANEATETISNPYMFTGQWYDPEIDQYYLRARMYDPEIGRFTSRDPVKGTFEEPLTLHVYLYCTNDPVNKIDPRGLWTLHLGGMALGSFGWSGMRQTCIVIDDDGNVGLMNVTGIGAGSPGITKRPGCAEKCN